MSEKMIELFLTDISYHLSSEELPKFTFEGIFENEIIAKQIKKEITLDPKECKLKFFIKLPGEKEKWRLYLKKEILEKQIK